MKGLTHVPRRTLNPRIPGRNVRGLWQLLGRRRHVNTGVNVVVLVVVVVVVVVGN